MTDYAALAQSFGGVVTGNGAAPSKPSASFANTQVPQNQTSANNTVDYGSLAQSMGGVVASTLTAPVTPAAPTDNGQLPDQGNFVANTVKSAENFGGGLVNAVTHPLKTISTLAKIGTGGVEKLAGEAPDTNTAAFDGLIHYFGQRYGGNSVGDVVNHIAKTAYTDPVGFLADLSTVFDGGSAAIGKVADVSKIGAVSDVADALGNAAEKTNPINLATKPIGYLSDVTGLSDKVAAARDAISAKLSQPFKINPVAGVEDAADSLGIDQKNLPASAVNDNPIVNGLEALSSKGAGATTFANKFADLTSSLDKIQNDTLAEAGNAQDLSTTGKGIATGLQKYETTFKNATSALYDQFSEAGGGKVAAVPQNTIDLLNKIISDKNDIADTQDVKFFQDKLKVLTGDGTDATGYKVPTFDTLKKIRTSIGEKVANAFGDPFAGSNKQALKGMYDTLTTDMNDTVKNSGVQDLGKKFQAAQDQYKAGLKLFNTGYSKNIRKFADAEQFDKIVPALIKKSTSVEDIPKIKKVIGDANFKQLQYHMLDQIFEKARSTDGTHFTAQGINKAIQSFGENNVKLILTPEQSKTLEDMQTITGAVEKAQKLAKGSQTAYLERTLATTGLTASAIGDLFVGNIHSALEKMVPVIGERLANKFVASDTGQTLLKEGINFSKITDSKVGRVTGKIVKGIGNQVLTNKANLTRNVVVNRSQQ